jgi:hypothetical protein
MYNNSAVNTITHELLHNYGLTDLYGNARSPAELSRMADVRATTLLTYEKWVMGWHPEQNVTCISGNDSQKINKFEIDIRDKEQIALLRPNEGSLYVIETSRIKENLLLSFYKLINDARPPIEYYSISDRKRGVKLSDFKYPNFADIHQGDEFTLLIYSVSDTSATVYTYPNSGANSSAVQALITEARIIQVAKMREARIKQDAEANAAAELRAKQDAEAKAAAEFNAKQEAETKAAAELKAKQEADAKAAAMKKTTITCVKGKLTKKVTAVKPKCPSGYKLKK